MAHHIPRAQRLTERAFERLDRFLHIEAASGIVLLIAAAAALIWANSPAATSYDALWHLPLSIQLGGLEFDQSLHFWINDVLMTVFFLVVGMEIRREMHEGALQEFRQAALPIGAAAGGVLVPALIYVALNQGPPRLHGWAVPTATDIAFAVGVLSLLGRGIPGNVRILLLALAIIDDIAAVLIIAFFYSGGLAWEGFLLAGAGLLLILGFQRMGIGSAFAYIFPGAVVWIGFYMTGAHPTLAGVVLGLLTPVRALPMREHPRELLAQLGARFGAGEEAEPHKLRRLRLAQREMLPPVARVQMALHPWVAFGIMPIFALANAGVNLGGLDLSATDGQMVMVGAAVALVVGKPFGVVTAAWLMVRSGLCALPPSVTWGGVVLVGLLAGIGFTMSIFIAMLAFDDESLLGAAKLGVLTGSVAAAMLGLAWGKYWPRLAVPDEVALGSDR